MNTAEIRNIGPIARILIPVPESGGVVVFRGANGVGKTSALNAIDKAITGRGDRLPIRDGELKGMVEGWGVRLTLGKSTARTGEAEVHSLDGRLSVDSLVDPGIKDPEKADAHRIRALVTLVGADPDPALFLPLFGSQRDFDRIVSPSSLTHQDLVSMAGAIKRDLEAASRKSADEAKNAAARADACRKAIEGIDLDAEADAKKLQAELEAAVGEKSRLETKSAAHSTAQDAARISRDALNKRLADYKGPTLEHAAVAEKEARDALETCYVERAAAELAVLQAKQRLEAAQKASARAGDAVTDKERIREMAEQHAAGIIYFRETIDAAANLGPVNAGDIVRAKSQVDQCRQHVEQGAIVRRARQQAAEAEQFKQAVATHGAEADALRDAARAVDNVLSEVVSKAGVPLRVEAVNAGLRLTTQTGRGRTCFGELSDGERWRIGLDIAINAVGAGGELTIGQPAWQDLDKANRQAIAARAREAGVIIYTAQADEGELRAEVYNGTS